MAPKKPLIVTAPIPFNNISLGRLVTDLAHPTQDAYTLPTPEASDVYTAPQSSYKMLLSSQKRTSLRAHLAVLGFNVSGDVDDKVIIDATMGKLYELISPTEWFGKVCATQKAREWLQMMDSNHMKIFYLTGLRTLTDAKVTVGSKTGRAGGGDVDVPVDAIASAAGVGLPVSFGLGVGGGATVERAEERSADFFVPGEQVYAIQYRRVKLTSEARNSSLKGPTVWRDVLSQRGEDDSGAIIKAETASALRLEVQVERVSDEGEEDEYLFLGS